MDARLFAAAATSAITAELGPHAAYEYGRLPGDVNGDRKDEPLPAIFVLVAVERRTNPLQRSTARSGSTGWRLLIRAAGRTTGEANWAMSRVAAAVDEKRLTVDGSATTPAQLESQEAARWDDGRFVVDALYNFTH